MTSTETKTYTMAQLRQSKKSLFVRNNTPLLWTLHEKVGNGQKIAAAPGFTTTEKMPTNAFRAKDLSFYVK